MIGGRKALENRRFIKHLASGQYSSGSHGDLNKAPNKIMTGNKLKADKSKEKRKVIDFNHFSLFFALIRHEFVCCLKAANEGDKDVYDREYKTGKGKLFTTRGSFRSYNRAFKNMMKLDS